MWYRTIITRYAAGTVGVRVVSAFQYLAGVPLSTGTVKTQLLTTEQGGGYRPSL